MNPNKAFATVLTTAALLGSAHEVQAAEQPVAQPAVAAHIGGALVPNQIQPLAADLDQADRLACAADAAALNTDATIPLSNGDKVGMATNVVRVKRSNGKKGNALQFSVDPTPLDEVFDTTGNTICKEVDVDQEVDVTFLQSGRKVASLPDVVSNNNGDGKKETATASLRRALRVGKALLTEVRTTGHVEGTDQTVTATQRYSFIVTRK